MSAEVNKLSVVIPAHNESSAIRSLLDETVQALDGVLDYEVIVVDDASSDSMAHVLATARTEIAALRVLTHHAQSGQSAGLMSGVIAATGDWIVTMDGDGQNDPADIPGLLDFLRKQTDTNIVGVFGWRKSRRDTFIRRLSSRVANGVRSTLLRDGTPDTGCGLKLMQRSAVLDLPRFNHMHRFLPALLKRDGGIVHSVEVNHRSRDGGESHYGLNNRLWAGIVDIFGVMWLVRRRGPGRNVALSENTEKMTK